MPWTLNWPAWNCAAPASRESCAATLRAAQEIDDLCETIRVLGGEGAPLVTCGFAVAHADEHIRAWRGYKDLPGGRAGTELRTFDAAWVEESDLVTWGIDTGDPAVRVPEAEVWRRMDGFMERVLPAAESAGVRLAFHPNGPAPCRSTAASSSRSSIPTAWVACWTATTAPTSACCSAWAPCRETGKDMPAALRRFGERGKLFTIHFRNVRGVIPRFEEVFQDEGDYNAADQMRTLHEVGFDGFVMPRPLPRPVGRQRSPRTRPAPGASATSAPSSRPPQASPAVLPGPVDWRRIDRQPARMV